MTCSGKDRLDVRVAAAIVLALMRAGVVVAVPIARAVGRAMRASR